MIITPAFIVLALIGGFLSALGGWLFRKLFNRHQENAAKIAALESQTAALKRDLGE